MSEKLYAQLDENNICFCIGTPEVGVVVDSYDYIGMKYNNGVWEKVPNNLNTYQPTNAEVAQIISDLYASLIIAGVL